MRLMEGEHVGPFNLGNPGEFTMLELAQVLFLFYFDEFLSIVSIMCIQCKSKLHCIYTANDKNQKI